MGVDNWALCDHTCDIFFLDYLHWFTCLFIRVPDCLGYCNFKENAFLFISSLRIFEQWFLNIFTLSPNFSHHQVQSVLPIYSWMCGLPSKKTGLPSPSSHQLPTALGFCTIFSLWGRVFLRSPGWPWPHDTLGCHLDCVWNQLRHKLPDTP